MDVEGKENVENASPFHEDRTFVFLGGLPFGKTPENVSTALESLGVTVHLCSAIKYRQYGWAYVSLGSEEDAQYLIAKSPIKLYGKLVDVRPFLNRRRVPNHFEKKPAYHEVLDSLVELAKRDRQKGITVAAAQTFLFRKFSYRLDGPELLWIVSQNPTKLRTSRGSNECIFVTRTLPETPLTVLLNKIYKLWRIISGRYSSDTISVSDLHNEFASLFRKTIDPANYGHDSMRSLFVNEMELERKLGIRIVGGDDDNDSGDHENSQFWKQNVGPNFRAKKAARRQHRSRCGFVPHENSTY